MQKTLELAINFYVVWYAGNCFWKACKLILMEIVYSGVCLYCVIIIGVQHLYMKAEGFNPNFTLLWHGRPNLTVSNIPIPVPHYLLEEVMINISQRSWSRVMESIGLVLFYNKPDQHFEILTSVFFLS